MMNKNNIWYGFLDAGGKSSAVVRDMSLDTEDSKTVYLYNLVRGNFIEYSREIVEPKLRQLKPGEISVEELDSAYKAARKTFNPGNGAKKWKEAVPTKATAFATAVENSEEEDTQLDMDEWDDFPDEDD